MKKYFFFTVAFTALLFNSYDHFGQIQKIDSGWHHLRNAEPREWSEFPAKAEGKKIALQFSALPHSEEYTVSLRQYDVKQDWRLMLNGNPLGALVADEKDLRSYYQVPPGTLQKENLLEIVCTDNQADDIRVGEINLHAMTKREILNEAHISLTVRDSQSGESLPARITIVDSRGILQTVAGSSSDLIALRPGHVYTASGNATLGMPAGTYMLYAGRGFEYGVDSARIELRPGDRFIHDFSIRREVATDGWISSDTHIHTFTWSGHGDASAEERALSIAGEGIELPIMTDHNLHVNINPFAISQSVDTYFTPVTGNEVTTNVGHFNVFPVPIDQPPIAARASSWRALSGSFQKYPDPKAVILNHARDIHLKFRPFDQHRHLSGAGARLDQWDLPANAMEIINSGSQQTDQLELTRDWFGLLNHGDFITPAGSSDSHDVSRYIVGQARTYIRSNDDNPATINVQEAVENFIHGHVMISFGLLAEIEVNNVYGPGELVPASNQIKISVKVSGPSWAWSEGVELFANGKKIREAKIENISAPGIKWQGDWTITVPTHDIFLVAVAKGPGRKLPYWPIAKPYQPVSPEWNPQVLGVSGAVWIDADKNGRPNAARDYAARLIEQSGDDPGRLIQSLAAFDEAVATQAAAILHLKGKSLTGPAITKALRSAAPETRAGFQTVIRELRALTK